MVTMLFLIICWTYFSVLFLFMSAYVRTELQISTSLLEVYVFYIHLTRF